MLPWWWNGRHEGLKIPWPEMAVRVRVSSEALLLTYIMKRLFFTIALLVMSSIGAFAQDVLGKWKLDDGSAIVEVYQEGDHYNGRIVWLAEPTDPNGVPCTDVMNPDPALRTRKIMGLNMLHDLKKKGDKYGDGKIYDPNDGKTYFCSMKVDGDVLKVHGSLDKKGWIGRTMDWHRVKE